MNSAIERFDEAARAKVAAHARTAIHPGELLRHPAYTRVLHWCVAIFFVLALLSGLAIYSPWLFPWLTPSRSEARPTESSPAPVQSIFLLSLRTGDSGTKRRVITTANAMTIAATQKIHS